MPPRGKNLPTPGGGGGRGKQLPSPGAPKIAGAGGDGDTSEVGSSESATSSGGGARNKKLPIPTAKDPADSGVGDGATSAESKGGRKKLPTPTAKNQESGTAEDGVTKPQARGKQLPSVLSHLCSLLLVHALPSQNAKYLFFSQVRLSFDLAPLAFFCGQCGAITTRKVPSASPHPRNTTSVYISGRHIEYFSLRCDS